MYVPLYATDEDPNDHFTLDEFLDANESLDPEEVEAIRALQPGQSYASGGGAAAEWTITHIRQLNPRFVLFCQAIGRDPEELSEREPTGDIKRIPYTNDPAGRSGPWTSVFMLWMTDRWREWAEGLDLPRQPNRWGTSDEPLHRWALRNGFTHDDFDAWLRERTLQGNVD